MRTLFLLTIALVASPVLAQTSGSCVEGTAQRVLDASNVQASVFTNGNLFFGGSTTSGDGYLVPKISRNSPMFAAGIWLSGRVNEEIRVSAARYGDYLFRPGPLNADGTLPNPSDCSAYDRIWVVNVAEVEAYEAGGSPARDLAEWPVGLGAPTVDTNGDPVAVTSREQVIDLAAGERPDLHGSQTAFWVMNDVAAPRRDDQTAPLGVEVQVTAFVIAGSELAGASESSFYRFRGINRSANTIENARWSFFTDPDLGDAGDDFVGTDTTRSMAFVYNDSNEDAAYGSPPPAIGYDILNHELAATSAPFGGGAAGAIDPNTPLQYYNFMQGLWSDSSTVREFGTGFYQTEGDSTAFMFSGDPVTESPWSEVNVDGNGTDNAPGDRRHFTTVAFGTLAPGDTATVDMALLFAVGADYLDSITELRAVSDDVQAAYDAGTLSGLGGSLSVLAAPVLRAPENHADVSLSDTLTFVWDAVEGAETYKFEWGSLSTRLTNSQYVDGPVVDLPVASLVGAQGRQQMSWRVTAVAEGAIGLVSPVQSLTLFRAGVLRLADGSPAYIEVVGPDGVLPCDAGAESPDGCDEVGGNLVYNSLNSTGEYYLGTAGSRGSEASLPAYAPNDFEIRFTDTGGLATYWIQSEKTIRVPFEVWDIGVVAPGEPNDPSDDVRLIPVLFADDGGTCAFDAAERDDSDSALDGYVESDRIYAYYPATTYDAYETQFAPLVDAAQDGCYEASSEAVDAMLDSDRRRPIQRQVFGSLATNPRLPGTGTIVRLYTQDLPQPVVDEDAPQLDGFALGPAYPNPSTSALAVPYHLAASGEVELAIYDVLGRRVVELVNARQPEGTHEATLDASALAPGVYVIQLRAGDETRTTRVTVVR